MKDYIKEAKETGLTKDDLVNILVWQQYLCVAWTAVKDKYKCSFEITAEVRKFVEHDWNQPEDGSS